MKELEILLIDLLCNSAQRRWCSQCAKSERAAIKQQYKEESQRRQTIDAELQV